MTSTSVPGTATLVVLGFLAAPAPAQQVLAELGGEPGMGYVVGGPGDLDGDGQADVLGCTGGSSIGRAWSSAGFQEMYTFSFPFSKTFGVTQMDGAGDMNGDGLQDFTFGGSGLFGVMTLRVYSGANGTQLHTFTQPPGQYVDATGGGDLNGDGRGDLLLATSGTPFDPRGVLRAYSGLNGAMVYEVPGAPFAYQAAGGIAVASLDDLDGDGVRDFAFGLPGHDFTSLPVVVSRIQIHSGAAGGLLHVIPGVLGEMLGGSLAAIGDVDGDGVPDLAAGEFVSDTVRIYSGATWSVLRTLTAGGRVESVGDVDGDGLVDVVTWPRANGPGRVFSAATGALLFGPLPGWTFDGAGDVNADGRADVIAGDGAASKVRVHSGCRGFTRQYGTACGGGGGLAQLAMQGCVEPNETVVFHVSGALGGAAGMLLLGANPAALPIGAGCFLNVAPPALWTFFYVHAPDGTAALPAFAPAAITGVTVHLQAFCADPTMAIGFTSSNGLEVSGG